MSNKPLKLPDHLLTQLHWGYIKKTSKATGRVPSTQLIFSVHDTNRIAWYVFYQTSSALSAAWDRDTYGKQASNIFGFGKEAWILRPSKPLTVDGFGGSNSVELHKRPLARLRVRRISTTALQLGMIAFLKSGPENLNWWNVLTTEKMEVPQEYEWGRIGGPMVVEDYGAGILRGAERFMHEFA